MPRAATPRLGLSTKGKAAVNPFKGNTMKVASLRTGYHELLLEKNANGTLSLRQFREVQEIEKEAGLADTLRMGVAAGANALKNRAPKFLEGILENVSAKAARSAQPGLTREVADAAEAARRSGTAVVPSDVRSDMLQRATQRQTAAETRLQRARDLESSNTRTPPPAAAPPPADRGRAAALPPNRAQVQSPEDFPTQVVPRRAPAQVQAPMPADATMALPPTRAQVQVPAPEDLEAAYQAALQRMRPPRAAPPAAGPSQPRTAPSPTNQSRANELLEELRQRAAQRASGATPDLAEQGAAIRERLPSSRATPAPAQETATFGGQAGQAPPPAAVQQPQAAVQQPQAGVQQTPTGEVAVTAPSEATGGSAAPSSAEELLNRLMRTAPVGVAGGLTAYGGLRGWNEGQAEVNRSLQQGFNPSTRY